MSASDHVWPAVRLHQVILDMQPGFAQRPNADNIGVPQLRTNNISPQGNIDFTDLIRVSVSPTEFEKYAVRRGDVIFNNTNSVEWVGKTAYFESDGDYVLSNHMTRIRVNVSLLDPEFLARYLYYMWKTGRSGSRAKQWVNQAAIDQAMLAQFELPLPPLTEQRRIVAILRQADQLRQLRHEADEKAQQLLPALFYEMFGPQLAENKGWESRKLSQLGEIQYGLTLNSTREQYSQRYPYLRVANVLRWELNLSDIATVGVAKGEVEKFKLLDGDVLVVEGHADPNQIGRAAVWRSELPICLHQNHLLRIRPNLAEITPNYLAGCLNSSAGKNYMLRHAKTSSGLNTINSTVLADMPVVHVPYELQQEFEKRYAVYRQSILQKLQSAKEIDLLFQSLLAQAFSGELTATWREEHEGLESMRTIPELPRPSAVKAVPESEYSLTETQVQLDRQGVVEALSSEQRLVFDLVNGSNGYCTIETLKANSDLPLYAIRQGVQLLVQVGLIQAVQLPDRPIRNVVYVPAYRALEERDQAGPPDLGLLQRELEKGLLS